MNGVQHDTELILGCLAFMALLVTVARRLHLPKSQLAGTGNRIAIEGMRFNEVAKAFNARRDSFPTNIVAGTPAPISFLDSSYVFYLTT